MSEDEFSGEKSVVPKEPTAADYEVEVSFFRSLAAIGLIYGTAGVVALPYGLLRFHQGAIAGDFRANFFDGPLRQTSADALWLFFSSLTGTGLALALMVGAVGALRLKSWSMMVLKLWAIASIIIGGGGSYFFFRWLWLPGREQLAEVRGVDDALVNLLGWLVGTILGVAMLVMLCRRRVRAALERDGTIIGTS